MLAFWLIGALAPTIASASDFRLRIEDASLNGVVITDDQIGDEAGGNPLGGAQPGVVNLTVSGLGGANTSLTMGLTKPAVFDPTALSFLFLNSITMTSTAAAHIVLTLEDTGYVSVPTALQLTSHVFDGAFSAPAGSTIRIQSWANTSNVAPSFGADTPILRDGLGNPIYDADGKVQHITSTLSAMGPLDGAGTPAQTYTSADAAFGSDTSGLFTASGPYSLFTQVVIDLAGPSFLTFQQEARVDAAPGAIDTGSPEPASLMLISMGVLGLAGARRRFMANLA